MIQSFHEHFDKSYFLGKSSIKISDSDALGAGLQGSELTKEIVNGLKNYHMHLIFWKSKFT